MVKYLVRADNGCGDHVAALIAAPHPDKALELARSLPDFPIFWDYFVKEYTGENTIFEGRPWLLDWEEYNHEEHDYEARYW